MYSTGPDYARFCQMLLGRGVWNGKRLLSPEAMTLLTTIQTGDLSTGFFQKPEYGNYGTNYGWGIGTCILRAPMLEPLPCFPRAPLGTAAGGERRRGSTRYAEWLMC